MVKQDKNNQIKINKMDKTDERRKSVGKKSSESNVHAEVTKSDK